MHFKQAFNVLLACTFLLKAHKALLCVCCKARIVVNFFKKRSCIFLIYLCISLKYMMLQKSLRVMKVETDLNFCHQKIVKKSANFGLFCIFEGQYPMQQCAAVFAFQCHPLTSSYCAKGQIDTFLYIIHCRLIPALHMQPAVLNKSLGHHHGALAHA